MDAFQGCWKFVASPQKKTQTSTTNPTTDEAPNDFPFPLGTANQPSTHRFGNCLVCLSLMWHQSQKGVKCLSPKTLDFFGQKWCENTVFLLTNAENSKFEAQESGFGLLLVFPNHFGLMFWFKMLNFRGVFKLDVHSSIFIETLWNRVDSICRGMTSIRQQALGCITVCHCQSRKSQINKVMGWAWGTLVKLSTLFLGWLQISWRTMTCTIYGI